MDTFDAEALGARIKRKRQERGIQQKELAKELRLSVSFYGHIERGTRIPSLPTLVKIANYLGIGTDSLLRDSLDAPCLPKTHGWTDRELGIFRQYLEERDLDMADWFSEEELKEISETPDPE